MSGELSDYVINHGKLSVYQLSKASPSSPRICEYAIQYTLFSNHVNVRGHLGDILYLSMSQLDGWLCVVPDTVLTLG